MERKALDLDALTARWPVFAPPDGFADRVLAALEPAARPLPRAIPRAAAPAVRRHRRAPIVVAAAALAASLLLLLTGVHATREAPAVGVACADVDLGSQTD